jgi:flagellum-specific peptidoglycan hydrolase FlgJ
MKFIYLLILSGFLIWNGHVSLNRKNAQDYELTCTDELDETIPTIWLSYEDEDCSDTITDATIPVMYAAVTKSKKVNRTVRLASSRINFSDVRDIRDDINIGNKEVEVFVKRFLPVALVEQEKYGIPASVTLAQAWLESGRGESKLARKSRNFFGIKSFSRKEKSVGHHDDFPTDRFRVFNSPWESFRGHSLLIVNNDRYGGIFEKRFDRKSFLKFNTEKYVLKDKKGKPKYDPHFNQKLAVMAAKWHVPYLRWSYGLDVVGYATNNAYAVDLRKFIERHKLNRWDHVKIANVPNS